MNIEELMGSLKTLKIRGLRVSLPKDEVVSIEFQDNDWWKLDSLSLKGFETVPCKPTVLMKDGVIFARLLVQVQWTDRSRRIEKLISAKPMYEAGATLAKLLQCLDKIQTLNFKEKVDVIRAQKQLLYETSTAVLKHVFELGGILTQYWLEVLELSNQYDQAYYREAKQLVFKMLTEGDGKNVAIVSADHLRYCKKIFAELTHHQFEKVSIEQSNFQSMLRVLRQANTKSSGFFMAATILDNLAPLDIATLIDSQKDTSSYLLIVDYPNLRASLDSTGKLQSVIIPPSFNFHFRHTVTPYDNTTAVGQCILAGTRIVAENMTQVEKTIEADLSRILEIQHENYQCWPSKVNSWRNLPLDLAESKGKNVFGVFISGDESYVDKCFSGNAILKDCATSTDLDNKFAEKIAISIAQTPVKTKVKDDLVSLLVFKKAHLLSEAHKSFIASSCITNGWKFIFVYPYFDPRHSSVKIKDAKTNQDAICKAEVWQPITAVNNIEYRYLRVLFDPLIIPHAGIEKGVESIKSQADFIKNAKQTIDYSVHVFRQLRDGSEVVISDLLTKILCVVYEYVSRQSSEIWQDVSFASFVRLCPACQWVSQELRIELWLRTIYFQFKKKRLPFDSMAVKSTNNVHSLHLMEYFDDETPVVPPSYRGFDGDEVYQQDIILQRCSKSEELGWKVIQEQWGQFPYSANYLLALVQSYSQPLKLLVNISEISLHNVLSGVGKTQEHVHSFQYLKSSLSTAWNGFFDLLAEELPFIKRFLASVKWNFFACLDEDRDLTFSPADIECLIEAHIPIMPTWNPKIVPTLLSLDGPRGILKNQIHVRHFLENISTESFGELIAESNVAIGPAAIEFILFLSETSVSSNLLLFDLFKFFYKWNKSEEPAVLAQYLAEHQVLRLKDSALSFCLTLQLDADKRTSLIPLFTLLQSNGRRISSIIHEAIKSTNSINASHCFANIILVLEQLNLGERLLVEDVHWNAIIASIQQGSHEPLKTYISGLLNGVAENHALIIPLESSIKLRDFYLEIFSDKAINWPKCDNLKVLLLLQSRLLSNAGRNSLRKALTNLSTMEHNFLNYYLWMLQPSDILKDSPTEIEIKPLKEMLHDTAVGFIQKCCENFFSLSTTALNFVSPCLLTAEVLQRFNKKLPEPHILLESPCRVTCNYRPLPRYVVDHMVNMYQPDEGQIAHWRTPSEDSDEYRVICSVLLHVDVTSGINQEILNKNVTVLALILEHSEFVKQREREAGLFVTSTFVAYLCNYWLFSAGFGTTDIRKMLQNKAFADVDLGELSSRLASKQAANLTIPIPTQVNIDPYFNRALKTHSLFGKWSEDTVYTTQVVTSLCKHIGIADKDMCMSPESIIGSIVKDILELLSVSKENNNSILRATVHFIKQLWRDNEALSSLMVTSLSTKLFTEANRIAVPTFSTIINLIGFSAQYWELLAQTVLAASKVKANFLSSTDTSSLSDLRMYCQVTQPKSLLNKLNSGVIGVLSGDPLPSNLCLSDLPNVREDLPDGNRSDFHSVAKEFGEQHLAEVLFNRRSTVFAESVISAQRDNLELKTNSNVVLTIDSRGPDLAGTTAEGQVEDIFVTKETKQSPITYYCFSILQMRRHNPYMEIYIPYGKSCYLVQLGEELDHVMVVPEEEVQTLLQLIKTRKSPSIIVYDYLTKKFDSVIEDTNGTEKYIIGTFPSYDVALDYIWRSAPPLSLILANTFSCKRHLNGPNWSMCQTNLNHAPHFYELVQFHNLINIPISVALKNVLLLLCRVLYQKYNDGKVESAKEVYDWFNSTLPTDIEEHASCISEFVCAVIDRSRDSNVAISSIIQDIATNNLKYNWMLETWPEFKGKLAFHLARNISNFTALKYILTRSEFDFKHFLHLAKQSEEEFNELSAALSVDTDQKTSQANEYEIYDDAMELDFDSEEDVLDKSEDKRFQHPFAVLPQPFDGFGHATIHHHQQLMALTKLDSDNFFYTWFIDLHRHKPDYDTTNGRLLALILPSSLFAQSKVATDVFLSWLAAVLRSPLSVDLKEWFMQRCRTNFLHPPPLSEENQLQLQIIASCISKACPDYRLKQYFTGSFVLKESVAKFCQRTNDEYGIYVCNTGYLQQLTYQKILVKELDLSLAAAGTVTPDKHYLNILSLFAGMTSFVYVRGLRVIDDLLLKWCAEFTKEFPWRFIFFENTSTMFNFSENRDRCKLSLYLPPTLEEMQRDNTYQMQICQTDCQRFDTWQHVTSYNLPRNGTEAIPDWENNLKAGIKNDPLVIFLVSPPGAGKTYLLEQDIMAQEAQRGCFCKRIDCSNDILVQKAMETVLSDQFPEEGKKSLLVADEFHMLSEAHKNALFDWIFPRLHWLKVVLIGNRSNDQDHDLLERVNKRSNNTFAQLIRCRLSVDKVLSAKRDVFNQDVEKDFIQFWQRSVRSLFSELALSLRNIEPILRAFRSTNPDIELTNLLNNKMPMLGQLCCMTFVRCLLDLFQNQYNCADLPTKESNSIRLLVIASLADETDSVMSYSEFITKLPKSNQIHPIVRLGSWITYVYQFVHPNTSTKELIDELPLDILKKLKLIDQHVFPLITKTESAIDLVLEKFDAFASTGNYSDLKWMADSIEHGYSINWRRVKEEWSANYVLDAKEFDRLLSVYSDVGVILSIIQRPNLCTLLERRSETSLALSVVKHFRKLDNEEQDPQSPYFTAAWFLFRHFPVQNAVATLKANGVDMLKTLVWASEFGFTKTGVKDNNALRNEMLQNELVDQSRVLMRSIGCGAVLAKLWGNLFAPMLSIGNQRHSLPNNAVLLLLQHVESVPPQWPRLMHVLKRILTKKASVDDAILVMNDSFFYTDNMIAGDILQPFLPGLLNLQGKATLPVDWQVMILGSCVVLPELSKEEVKNHFGLGLRHLHSKDDILLLQVNQPGDTCRWLEELFNECSTKT